MRIELKNRKRVIWMAERRMFSKTIIQSDQFCELPFSAQALYLHLALYADDDGFVNNTKLITRMIGAKEEDIRMLIEAGYLIGFESGVVVITHWLQHNLIRSDRYKETIYLEEKRHLAQQEDKKYCFIQNPEAVERFPVGIPTDNQVEPQGSKGKKSKEKNSQECSEEVIEYQLGNEKLSHTQYERLKERFGEKALKTQIERILNHPYNGCLNENTISKWCEEAKSRNVKNGKGNFLNYEQNEYDFEELERQLLAN